MKKLLTVYLHIVAEKPVIYFELKKRDSTHISTTIIDFTKTAYPYAFPTLLLENLKDLREETNKLGVEFKTHPESVSLFKDLIKKYKVDIKLRDLSDSEKSHLSTLDYNFFHINQPIKGIRKELYDTVKTLEEPTTNRITLFYLKNQLYKHEKDIITNNLKKTDNLFCRYLTRLEEKPKNILKDFNNSIIGKKK